MSATKETVVAFAVLPPPYGGAGKQKRRNTQETMYILGFQAPTVYKIGFQATSGYFGRTMMPVASYEVYTTVPEDKTTSPDAAIAPSPRPYHPRQTQNWVQFILHREGKRINVITHSMDGLLVKFL